MNSKPDDRRDNVKKIQKHIDDTIENMELADEMAASIDNPKTIKELDEKNKRRETALEGMRKEIKDEAKWQQNRNKY